MFPEEDLRDVRRCLFGFRECAAKAVLTPSGTLFDSLTRDLPVTARGWWRTARAPDFMACQTPQSSAIRDAVAALDRGTEITFLGFCGGLGAQEIGEIFEPERALLGRAVYRRTHPISREYPAACVATVYSLSCSLQPHRSLPAVTGLVDLETGHVFFMAGQRRCPARALLIVSDRPPSHPFYRTSASGVTRAVEELSERLRLNLGLV